MIARFFKWWTGELRALFATNPKPRQGKTLVFQPDERGTLVSEQRRSRMRELGWFAPDGSYSPGLDSRLKRFKPDHTGLRFEALAEEFLEKTLAISLPFQSYSQLEKDFLRLLLSILNEKQDIKNHLSSERPISKNG